MERGGRGGGTKEIYTSERGRRSGGMQGERRGGEGVNETDTAEGEEQRTDMNLCVRERERGGGGEGSQRRRERGGGGEGSQRRRERGGGG